MYYKSDECEINHKGSSVSMEKEAVVQLFSRSLDYKLRYIRILGDGDSKSYAAVRALNDGKGPYHKCVNEFQVNLSDSENEDKDTDDDSDVEIKEFESKGRNKTKKSTSKNNVKNYKRNKLSKLKSTSSKKKGNQSEKGSVYQSYGKTYD